ncbi:MAG: hypothetical protein Q9M40_02490 [Sulfurimonas sp.]|nr:hypothetical protein [Sulfurimonas sp.]MDQ7066949.1 hypothetical protein [Sulfurimonas sp.]
MIKYLLLFCLYFSLAAADTFKIAGTFLSMDYVETSRNGSFLDSEKSNYSEIPGLDISYAKTMGNGSGGANESALTFGLEFSQGATDYDGFLQSTGTPTLIPFKTTTQNMIIEPKIRWSETNKGSKYDIGVFASLGYRYWERNLGSQYGYQEQYSWFYPEVGLKMLFHESNWHIGLEFAYQYAYKPKMYAAINNGIDFDLGNTYGYYYEIPLVYDINRNYSIEVAYKADYWSIDASNVVDGYYEPSSQTNNQQISIGLIIKW